MQTFGKVVLWRHYICSKTNLELFVYKHTPRGYSVTYQSVQNSTWGSRSSLLTIAGGRYKQSWALFSPLCPRFLQAALLSSSLFPVIQSLASFILYVPTFVSSVPRLSCCVFESIFWGVMYLNTKDSDRNCRV